MRILLKVVPKSSRDRIVGWIGDRLKVVVTAAPERGKANQAVRGVLAEALELPVSRIRIVGGEASPEKTVEIDGAGEDWVSARLPGRPL